MLTNDQPNSLQTEQSKSPLALRIGIAWLAIFIALAFSGWLGEHSEQLGILDGRMRYLLQAVVMVTIVLTSVWLLRTRLDRGTPATIGIQNFKSALLKFGLGLGLFLIPMVLTIACTVLFGWGKVHFNTNATVMSTVPLGILTVFLFEALPEELMFRGYIYSNLNTGFQRWKAGLLTVALFVLLPPLLVPVQKHLLGMEVYVGGAGAITGGYLITMFFFGCFVQYLRILTGSIWTGIGFHLMFVYINRLIGLESTNLIQFYDIQNEAPMQIILLGLLGLTLVGLILYPRLSGSKLGWKERYSSSATA